MKEDNPMYSINHYLEEKYSTTSTTNSLHHPIPPKTSNGYREILYHYLWVMRL